VSRGLRFNRKCYGSHFANCVTPITYCFFFDGW
jgi:hypothetical protein